MGHGTYYNEIDTFAAEWLRNLIKKGLIPDGEVDTRSIADVVPSDLGRFRQHHFFAGIGGWAHALRLAGWPDDRPVWTGSCPCQPFSVAGKGKGTADERHLWPEFFRLISEFRPPIIFGEQVASKAGREWLTGVFSDLEGVGYAGAGADLCAPSVGAPHIRQRLYWVALADTSSQQKHEEQQGPSGNEGGRCADGVGRCGLDNRQGDMADTDGELHDGRGNIGARGRDEHPDSRGSGDMADGNWSNAEWRRGADGKERRVKPGVRLLVDGFPNRVGILRGFGNAIVPQVAAEFIRAFSYA